MSRNHGLKSRILLSSSAVAIGAMMSAGFIQSALAQDNGNSGASQTIVVTGSRIVRRDYTSNSPIVTVNSKTFEDSSNVAIEATLNKLPQFTADQNLMGINSGDIQPTAVHAVGASTASLRGLGANRNLVLMDGRRLMPVDGLNDVDLNSIPSAAIERVETITGGASAVYGADAITGVVNFILKKNFEGLDLDAQYGLTQLGDDREFKVSALMGTNFADDKGNVMFGVEHYTRGPTPYNNRDFYKQGWHDPTTASNAFFLSGSYYSPRGADGCPSVSAMSSVVGTPPAGASTCLAGFGPQFEFAPASYTANGSGIYTNGGLFNVGVYGASNWTGPMDGYNRTNQTVYDFGSTTPYTQQKTNYTNDIYNLLAPLERWSAYGQGHYQITDNLSAFIIGNFTQTHTTTTQIPTPFINGWGVLIPRDASHPVPASLATLLDSRTTTFGTSTASDPWQLNVIPDPNYGTAWNGWLPPRSTDVTNTTWQIQAGLDGKLPFKDWTWEMFGSHGQTLSYSHNIGAYSLERYRTLMLAPNYGAGFDQKGNQNPANPQPGFGTNAEATCTSGFYDTIFLGKAPSADCLKAISAPLQTVSVLQQDIVEFDAQGGIMDLPAGELRGAVGAEYRSNTIQFNPDQLQSGLSWTDQVAGLYPAGYSQGAQRASEGYGELLVPVLSDLPGVKKLSFDLGARYSVYDIGGHGWTYKIQSSWEITNWLRARGGYNLAVRAPSVGEAYLGLQQVFGAGAQYGDPCSLQSTAPFGAGGANNALLAASGTTVGFPATPVTTAPVTNTGGLAGAQNVFAMCQALMGVAPSNVNLNPTSAAALTGGGGGAAVYYGGAQPATAASLFGFNNQVGNPNLRSEKAATWTAGLVVTSPFDQPILSRFNLSIDWYDIRIAHAIEFESADYAKQLCYTQNVLTGGVPDPAKITAALNSFACSGLTRVVGTGGEDQVLLRYENLATIWTSGIDAQLNWGMDFADMGLSQIPGSINLNVLVNYLLDTNTRASPTDPIIHWRDSLGPNLAGTQAGAFAYKTYTTLTYNVGPLSVGLNWRHLPGIRSAGAAVQDATGVVNTTADTASHDEVDLFGNYTVNRILTVRAGISNLFDAAPEITGAGNGQFAGAASVVSSGAGTTNAGLYDTLGRRFFVGINVKY